MAKNYTMDTIVSLAKSRGFVYPGSEIYGGLANTWESGRGTEEQYQEGLVEEVCAGVQV